MRTVLVVGGDHVDGIKEIVSEHGDQHQFAHWSGRKSGDHHKPIPKNTQLVILITSWVNHSFMYAIKRKASKRNLKIVYATNLKHARQHVMEQLGEDGGVLSACRKTYNTLINWTFSPVAYTT
jgi:hypothetical protein